MTSDELVIFVMATYGEGDPTDNAIDFMKWLKTEEDTSALSKMSFAVRDMQKKSSH